MRSVMLTGSKIDGILMENGKKGYNLKGAYYATFYKI